MRLLTDNELRQDLEGLYTRLQRTRSKLAELPKYAKSWKEQKSLKTKRSILQDEKKHVQNLIHIGETALQDTAIFGRKRAGK